MAIVWVMRAMILATPTLTRLVQSGQPTTLQHLVFASEAMKRRLADPNESDEDLTAALQKENPYPVNVATYTGDFTTRRVQLSFEVSGTYVIDEDVRVITFHHVKLAGGLPTDQWDGGDFGFLVDQYVTWWNAIKHWYSTGLKLKEIAFYKAGPNIVPPQPPVFAIDENLPGLSANPMLPPQVALSVTEMAGQKKNWGRFYLPSPAVQSNITGNSCTLAGRPATLLITEVINATDTLYTSVVGVFLPFVVYRPYLPAGRPHEGATPLPERPANAQTVDSLQIDDIFDVIRRRRWEHPQLREQRLIGGALLEEPTQLPAVQPEGDVSGDPPAAQTP